MLVGLPSLLEYKNGAIWWRKVISFSKTFVSIDEQILSILIPGEVQTWRCHTPASQKKASHNNRQEIQVGMNPPQLRLLSLEPTLSTTKNCYRGEIIERKSVDRWWVGRWRSFLRNPVARGEKICVVVILQLPTISSLERHTHTRTHTHLHTHRLSLSHTNSFLLKLMHSSPPLSLSLSLSLSLPLSLSLSPTLLIFSY